MVDVPTTPPGGSTEFGPERRRNHRVQITIPVIVTGQAKGKLIEEHTKTIVVNLNGCLVRMRASVIRNQEFTITNAATEESAKVRVSYIGRSDGEGTEIGLGFLQPTPKFWRISFPPEVQDPTERKRFVPSAPPADAPKK
ncbi:MAG TPA: hypothetical protein VJW93_15855 [Candidatus Acidoferrales bacterium]|nr:hypothetical protein [Candidatus Acidoferrales bacterium]